MTRPPLKDAISDETRRAMESRFQARQVIASRLKAAKARRFVRRSLLPRWNWRKRRQKPLQRGKSRRSAQRSGFMRGYAMKRKMGV